MRSYLLHALFALAFLCLPNLLKAQPFNITGHHENDTCGGKIIFTFNINQWHSGLSYTTFFGDGASQHIPSSQGLVFYNMHDYAAPGTYTVKHVLYYNGSAVDSIQFSLTTSLCNHVYIKVYEDINNNCIPPSTSSPGYALVEIDSAGTKIDTVECGPWLTKLVKLTAGKTYTFKLLSLPLGATANCPSTGIQTVTIPNSFNNTTVNFGYQCSSTSQFDLAIVNVQGFYRPVNNSWINIYAQNIACGSKNAVVTATFSPKFSYVSASPTPASVSGNTVTWNTSNLTFKYYTIQLLADTSLVHVGDTICASASISPTSGDANTSNNTASSCDTVRASLDPNSKEVSPAGAITSGTELTYTINFENMGNDTAFNIHILDTLSNKLDENSFGLLSSSHHVTPLILSGPLNTTILKFNFSDIKLPDSTHPEANKGFVMFRIKTKTALAYGTQIENRAGIYFDINPVVMTNSALNWIGFPQNVSTVAAVKQAEIYPNPNTGTFTIKTDSKVYNNAKLVNALGQVVAEESIPGTQTIIDTRALPAGIYYLLLSGPGGSMAEKIEKK